MNTIYYRTRKGVGTDILNKFLYSMICCVCCLFIAMMFVSCGDDEKIEIPENMEPKPILFGGSGIVVNGGSSTRAVVESENDILDKNVSIFGVQYTTAQNWNNAELLMNNVTGRLTSTSEGNLFSYFPLKHYAAGDDFYYDFRMIYPTDASEGVTIKPATASSGPMAEINLLQADLQTDLMMASADGIIKRTDSIPMELKHKLVQVEIQIKKSANFVQAPVMRGMTIEGPMSASLDIVTGSLSFANTPGNPGKYEKEMPENGIIIKEDEYQTLGNVLLFPIKEGKENVSESYQFVLTINERNLALFLPQEGDKWEAGNRYLYKLELTETDVIIVIYSSEPGTTEDPTLGREPWEPEYGEDDEDNKLEIW